MAKARLVKGLLPLEQCRLLLEMIAVYKLHGLIYFGKPFEKQVEELIAKIKQNKQQQSFV
jgi:hypothetical protein